MSAVEDRLRGIMLQGMAGDSAAYHLFLKDLSGHLRGFFRKRLTQLPDEVEDLVQETLLAVHNQRHTYQSDQPLTAWVHAIARFKLVDMWRRRNVREALNDPLDEEHELLSQSYEAAADAKRDVVAMLAQLPDRHRLPIQYVKLEGLSVIEAAARAGMSESAVKVGIHRGLAALAKLMKVVHEH